MGVSVSKQVLKFPTLYIIILLLIFYLQETLSQLVQMQTATKKRIAEIKGCEATIEKAFQYLTKVLSWSWIHVYVGIRLCQ